MTARAFRAARTRYARAPAIPRETRPSVAFYPLPGCCWARVPLSLEC